jgi:hypothetical protein
MKYLIFETELGAKTRSAQEAANRGAGIAEVTKYWWSCEETESNSFIINF